MTCEEFEKKVMNLLLSGDDEISVRLRKQYDVAESISRNFIGSSYFTVFHIDDEKLRLKESIKPFGGVSGFIKGIEQVKFRILMKNGFLSSLVGIPLTTESTTVYDSIELVQKNPTQDTINRYQIFDGMNDEYIYKINEKYWDGWTLESINIDYDVITITIEFESPESKPLTILCKNHLGISYIGQWDESWISDINVKSNTDLIKHSLKKVIELNGDNPRKGGGIKQIGDDWKELNIILDDNLEIKIIFRDIELFSKII